MASPEAPKPASSGAAGQHKVGGILFARNNVPYYQRYYQKAFANHVRLWNVHPRSQWYMKPYLALFYTTMGATLYMCGRKALGYNTWFSEN
jgi:hypothetical protein